MKTIVAFLLVFVVCFGMKVSAQITVTPNTNAAQLAQKIVGNGVTISNANFIGWDGTSAGTFTDNTGTLGIDSGIVLTNGKARAVSGPFKHNTPTSSAFAASASGYNGYADLDTIASNTIPVTHVTNDASVLEFDFIPQGDSINVKFVFGSAEYDGYVCSNFNDVFAFFVSGPGFTGQQNIALVPNTMYPVAIHDINDSTCFQPAFPQYYIDNVHSNGQYLTYAGYTTVLKAVAKVQPCQTYHIKLAIADVGVNDHVYDSGVFIEANSFSSNGIQLTNNGGFTDAANNTILVRGCKGTELKVQLNKPATSPVTANFTYTGTAIYGVDYSPLPASLLFNPGDSVKYLEVFPLLDLVPEPTKTLTISMYGFSCGSSLPIAQLTYYINDSITFQNIKDTFVCSAFPTQLTSPKNDTTSNKYVWSNGDTTQQTSVSTPASYWVVHTFSQRCFDIDTFHVVNGDPTLSLSPLDTAFCNSDSILLSANVSPIGGIYLWNTGDINPAFYVNNSGVFSITYTALDGCYLNAHTTTTRKPLPYPYLGNDTTLCTYESLLLNGYYPGATYLWSTGATSSTITVKDSAQYFVKATLNGCSVSDTILVGRKLTPIANAGMDDTIFVGGIARLKALEDVKNAYYNWTPAQYLNYSDIYNPYATPPVTTPFYLTVTSPDNCILMDTVVVVVKDYDLIIPNAFSPNGDGINDKWVLSLLNSYINARVQVFDRNGSVIFNSTGYDVSWDGTINGKPLPIGTYYYIIEPGNGRPRRSGSVTILR